MKIAYLFKTNVAWIKRLNNMISDDLYPGQILKLEARPDDPDLAGLQIALSEQEF